MAATTLRPATAADGQFLAEMAVEAANWRPNAHRPRNEVLSDPVYSGYVAGWPRPADRGVIAETDDGEAIGAAWYRQFNRGAPGQAFVGTGVPELIVGVRSIWRSQGVGRELIRELCRVARAEGLARIALSVDRENFAVGLYRSEGFATVGSAGARDTMVKHLR